jgi:hypothetical protein
MTEAQSPGNGMGRGDAEINSAAEFSLASLLNRTHNAMLAAAWALAAAAWEVFPGKWTGPYAKAPMTVNGHLNATMDPDQIKLWWTKWPNAMIGARVPDNCIVIDIDPRNGGSIEALEEWGPLPATERTDADTLARVPSPALARRRRSYRRPTGLLRLRAERQNRSPEDFCDHRPNPVWQGHNRANPHGHDRHRSRRQPDAFQPCYRVRPRPAARQVARDHC